MNAIYFSHVPCVKFKAEKSANQLKTRRRYKINVKRSPSDNRLYPWNHQSQTTWRSGKSRAHGIGEKNGKNRGIVKSVILFYTLR